MRNIWDGIGSFATHLHNIIVTTAHHKIRGIVMDTGSLSEMLDVTKRFASKMIYSLFGTDASDEILFVFNKCIKKHRNLILSIFNQLDYLSTLYNTKLLVLRSSSGYINRVGITLANDRTGHRFVQCHNDIGEYCFSKYYERLRNVEECNLIGEDEFVRLPSLMVYFQFLDIYPHPDEDMTKLPNQYFSDLVDDFGDIQQEILNNIVITSDAEYIKNEDIISWRNSYQGFFVKYREPCTETHALIPILSRSSVDVNTIEEYYCEYDRLNYRGKIIENMIITDRSIGHMNGTDLVGFSETLEHVCIYNSRYSGDHSYDMPDQHLKMTLDIILSSSVLRRLEMKCIDTKQTLSIIMNCISENIIHNQLTDLCIELATLDDIFNEDEDFVTEYYVSDDVVDGIICYIQSIGDKQLHVRHEIPSLRLRGMIFGEEQFNRMICAIKKAEVYCLFELHLIRCKFPPECVQHMSKCGVHLRKLHYEDSIYNRLGNNPVSCEITSMLCSGDVMVDNISILLDVPDHAHTEEEEEEEEKLPAIPNAVGLSMHNSYTHKMRVSVRYQPVINIPDGIMLCEKTFFPRISMNKISQGIQNHFNRKFNSIQSSSFSDIIIHTED